MWCPDTRRGKVCDLLVCVCVCFGAFSVLPCAVCLQDAVTIVKEFCLSDANIWYLRMSVDPTLEKLSVGKLLGCSLCVCDLWLFPCVPFGPIGQKLTASVTQACAKRPGVAASVSRRRRERRTLLAGGGRRASRSHTLAASQAFERMHMLFCHRVKT